MLMRHTASSIRGITPIIGPSGQAIIGASVVPNFQAPIKSGTTNGRPATESIDSFVLSKTPGTISKVVAKNRKRSVAITEEE
jgi:hypothetical protein